METVKLTLPSEKQLELSLEDVAFLRAMFGAPLYQAPLAIPMWPVPTNPFPQYPQWKPPYIEVTCKAGTER